MLAPPHEYIKCFFSYSKYNFKKLRDGQTNGVILNPVIGLFITASEYISERDRLAIDCTAREVHVQDVSVKTFQGSLDAGNRVRGLYAGALYSDRQ